MKNPAKIAFLGDSVTEGCFELYPCSYGFDTVRRPEDGYVHKTLLRLNRAGASPIAAGINFGQSGLSTLRALACLSDVADCHPDLAVVCFGLNDIFHPEERFAPALDEMLTKLRQIAAHLVLITPNRMNTYLHPKTLPAAYKVAERTMCAQTNGTFDRMMDTARAAASSVGARLCDIYADWTEEYKNGVDITEKLANFINHPTPLMHDRIADKLYPVLSEYLF